MTAYWFLPAWFGLIALGWMLRDRREQIFDWLGELLGAEHECPHLELVRSNVRRLPVLFDQDQEPA